MTSSILTDALREIDARQAFDSSSGVNPFMLLYGNGSRVELEFTQRMHIEPHTWVVCLGIPCGTSLWHVGDLSEQNGHFNVLLGKSKARLIQE